MMAAMGHPSTAEAVNELADRYVAVWNEPDPEARRGAICELWTEGGAQVLQPPREVREAAMALGMDAIFESRGHRALEALVHRAHEEFVAPGEFRFRRRPNAARLDGIVKFNWEMVHTSDGSVAAVGLELLVLGDDGRIVTDYQFIEA
jgi:hypothetical protein